MKNILYMGIALPHNHVVEVFSRSLLRSLQLTRYQAYVYGDILFCGYFKNPKIASSEQIAEVKWDVVIVQNSRCFSVYAGIIRSLRKIPIIFVSNADDITGYVAPFDNLYAVLTTSETNLTHWNIPSELCKSLRIPVIASGNHYRYDEQPERYELVYCPVQNGNSLTDSKILSLANHLNCRITIIGEEYRTLLPAMSNLVRIVSRKRYPAIFKKAHLIIASGYQTLQALALCKPCVVAGSHGLGGKVTAENYAFFKKYGFKGRPGAAANEHIPLNLLQAEVQQALFTPCDYDMTVLHNSVLADGYSFKSFQRAVTQTVEQVLMLHGRLKNRRLHNTLKPRLSNTFHVNHENDKNIISCGQVLFNEVDDDLLALLRQCDGTQTIEEIVMRNGYDREDVRIFADNIMELWKKKLIVFSNS